MDGCWLATSVTDDTWSKFINHTTCKAKLHIKCSRAWSCEWCKMTLQCRNCISRCWQLFYNPNTRLTCIQVINTISSHYWSKMNYFDSPWDYAMLFQNNSSSSWTESVRSISKILQWMENTSGITIWVEMSFLWEYALKYTWMFSSVACNYQCKNSMQIMQQLFKITQKTQMLT